MYVWGKANVERVLIDVIVVTLREMSPFLLACVIHKFDIHNSGVSEQPAASPPYGFSNVTEPSQRYWDIL